MFFQRLAAVLLLFALLFPRALPASQSKGVKEKEGKQASRIINDTVAISGGGQVVTVEEVKNRLSAPMAAHLPPGITPRIKVEETLRDALFENLAKAALRQEGIDGKLEGEVRVIRNRIVAFRFRNSVLVPRLKPTEQEMASLYPRKWVRARFHQITLATRTGAERALEEAKASPEKFLEMIRERSIGPKADVDGLTAFLEPLPFTFMLTPEMDAALFSLKPGEFSPVLASEIGYSVFRASEVHELSPTEIVEKKKKIEERLVRENEAVYLQALEQRYSPWNLFEADPTKAYSLLRTLLDKGEASTEEAVRAGDLRLSFESVAALRALFRTPNPGKEDPLSTMSWLNTLVKETLVPEALLAQAASEEGFRLSEEDTKAMQMRAERWLLDRFYDLRIEPSTKISAEEVRRFFEENRPSFRRSLRVDYRVIHSASLERIREAERRIFGKGRFEDGWKWAKKKGTNTALDGEEHAGVLVDDVKESVVRNALRGLRPGQCTGTLSFQGHYYIVSLDRVTEWEDIPFGQVEEAIRGNLYSTKREEALLRFFEANYPGMKIETDKNAVDHLVRFFEDVLDERTLKLLPGGISPPHGHRGQEEKN